MKRRNIESWGRTINGPKVDNSPAKTRAKVEIRRRVLQAIGDAAVFDCFAGAGEMYRAVWREAAEYCGCDLRFFGDERPAFVADNRRVLRAIDLYRYNLFDIDAYGCPWEQVLIIAARRPLRPGERLGMVITEGQFMRMKLAGLSRATSILAGLRTVSSNRPAPGIHNQQEDIVNRAVKRTAELLGGTVSRRFELGKKDRDTARQGIAGMLYFGLVFEAAA